MPYTAQFFAEKLNVPVEYFNPLRNVQIDPAINLEELARVAHSLGEVVGLGLRNLAHCPVELNLMPESTLKWQSFNQKKPYLIATVFSMVLVVAAIGLLFDRLAGAKATAKDELDRQVGPLKQKDQRFQQHLGELKKAKTETDQVVAYMDQRFYWADVLSELRQILTRVEGGMRTKLRADTGIWIDKMITVEPREGESQPVTEAVAGPTPGSGYMRELQEIMRRRYRMGPGCMAGMPGAPALPTESAAPAPGTEGTTDAAGTAKVKDTNSISSITITFRAIGMSAVQPDANKEIVFSVLNEIRNSPLFDPAETKDNGNIGNEEPPGTFTFGVTAGLKRPFKL